MNHDQNKSDQEIKNTSSEGESKDISAQKNQLDQPSPLPEHSEQRTDSETIAQSKTDVQSSSSYDATTPLIEPKRTSCYSFFV